MVALSLAAGLLVAAAFFAWTGFFQSTVLAGDALSYTGRTLRTLPSGATAVLVATAQATSVRLDDPVVQYVAGRRARQALVLSPDALPPNLPAGSMLIVQPEDRVLTHGRACEVRRRRGRK